MTLVTSFLSVAMRLSAAKAFCSSWSKTLEADIADLRVKRWENRLMKWGIQFTTTNQEREQRVCWEVSRRLTIWAMCQHCMNHGTLSYRQASLGHGLLVINMPHRHAIPSSCHGAPWEKWFPYCELVSFKITHKSLHAHQRIFSIKVYSVC